MMAKTGVRGNPSLWVRQAEGMTDELCSAVRGYGENFNEVLGR